MAVKNTIDLKSDWMRFKKFITNELVALAEALTGKLIEYAPPVQLKTSFGYSEPIVTEDSISLSVGTPLMYGEFVEFGTQPHFAPIAPLIRWAEQNAQAHLVAVGVEYKEGRALPSRKGTIRLRGDARTKAINNLAYAVRAKIAKEGTKAQRFMQRALNELGLTYKEQFSSQGAVYQVDILSWLEKRIETIAKKSGFAK